MLMSFSIKRTVKQLFTFETDEQLIYCIYGLKGISLVFLFISFKFLTIGHMPFTNRTSLTEVSNFYYVHSCHSVFIYLCV